MKRQIIAIHGGDTYDTYDKYLEGLKKEQIDYEDLFKKGWKTTLGERLGPDYEVLTPRMPNEANAKYLEWKIWFDKIVPFIREGVIFIGHSLGGMLLARYLSENTISKKVRATMIVASPHTEAFDQSLADFIIPKDLTGLQNQGGDIFLYYSSDDPLVPNPLAHLKKYQDSLPKSHAYTFTDRGHFSGSEFPEIIEHIKQLS